MIDDLLRLTNVPLGGSVLDIGCGTGKSSEPFAKRGFVVTALDPGANMLAVCKKRLAAYANVTFEQASFESWSADGRGFDLVISGTAFHWVESSARSKLLEVARRRGALGIFWHTYLNGRNPFFEQLDRIYKAHAPTLYVSDLAASQELADREKEEQALSLEGFSDWRVIRYYDNIRYDAEGYVNLLRTWSTHADLSQSFYEAVGLAIHETGGSIEKPIRTTLCVGLRP